jgi:hypothetical protein
MSLRLTDNRKTSFKPNHYNTFGLSYGLPKNGGTCPGATCGKGGCLDVRDGLKRQTCYMAKITAIYKNVGVVLEENTKTLIGKSVEEMKVVCRDTIKAFIQKSKNKDLYFRLHYSGDFFSQEYAQAWADVIMEYPEVMFWAYTRSYDFIEPLLKAKNMSLYLSCDPVNYKKAKKIYDKLKDTYVNLGLAWLGEEAPKLIGFERFIFCPETTGKIKSTKEAGACSKCRLCIDNYKNRIKNIAFKIH